MSPEEGAPTGEERPTPEAPEWASIRWHGQELRLRPDASLWWPDGGTLFVADLHLGKGATFRARGIPVPSGDTGRDLERLDRAVAETGVERVVLLGDLYHAPESRQSHVERGLARWRAGWPSLEVTLVRGNHDRLAGDPDAALQVVVREEPVAFGPFELRHVPPGGGPEEAEQGRPVLAGHLHPVVRLRGPARDRARLPCFWVRSGTLVLPAFGSFTGGWPVPATRGDRVFVPVEGGVVEVGSG